MPNKCSYRLLNYIQRELKHRHGLISCISAAIVQVNYKLSHMELHNRFLGLINEY